MEKGGCPMINQFDLGERRANGDRERGWRNFVCLFIDGNIDGHVDGEVDGYVDGEVDGEAGAPSTIAASRLRGTRGVFIS